MRRDALARAIPPPAPRSSLRLARPPVQHAAQGRVDPCTRRAPAAGRARGALRPWFSRPPPRRGPARSPRRRRVRRPPPPCARVPGRRVPLGLHGGAEPGSAGGVGAPKLPLFHRASPRPKAPVSLDGRPAGRARPLLCLPPPLSRPGRGATAGRSVRSLQCAPPSALPRPPSPRAAAPSRAPPSPWPSPLRASPSAAAPARANRGT